MRGTEGRVTYRSRSIPLVAGWKTTVEQKVDCATLSYVYGVEGSTERWRHHTSELGSWTCGVARWA